MSTLSNVTFSDDSSWFVTENYSDFENEIGGTKISVTNSSTNARYFKATYTSYYWYKK